MGKPTGKVPFRALSRRGGYCCAPAELLESRQHLSASPAANLTDTCAAAPLAASTTTIRQLALHGDATTGLSIVGDGTGQTIAITEPYLVSDLRSQLQQFDKQYGLADPPKLTIINQGGKATEAPDAGTAQQIAADVEAVHAAAPGAEIIFIALTGSGTTTGGTDTGNGTGATATPTPDGGRTIRTFFRRSGDPVSAQDAQAVFAAPTSTNTPRVAVAAGISEAARSEAAAIAVPESSLVTRVTSTVVTGGTVLLTSPFSTTPFAVTQSEVAMTRAAINVMVRATGRVASAVQAFVAGSAPMTTGGQVVEASITSGVNVVPFLGKVVYNLVHIDALAAFADPASAFIEESAGIPVLAQPSRARAWVVTGAVLAADAAIVAYFFATRRNASEDETEEASRSRVLRRVTRRRELLFENVRDFSATV